MACSKKAISGALTVILFGLFFSSALLLAQKDKKKREVYAATMVGTRGAVGGRSLPITIRIFGETSDEERDGFLELIRAGKNVGKSSDLRQALKDVKGLGNISADGHIGTDLAVVRQHETDNGRLINLVTARNLSFMELYHAGRSTDYPFSVVQLLVDKEGKGQGTVIMAARVKFNDQGALEVESYGLQPFQLFNVRLW